MVESYLDCVVRKDFHKLPIAPGYTSESPLSSKLSGQAAVDYLWNIAQGVKAIRIQQHIVEGNHVATLFEEDTVYGPLPVFALWEIEDGRVKDVRVFYDPRRISNPSESG